jgi:transcription factor TFIIIB component B''
MTGKDFSGPTPQIKAPPPLSLREKPAEDTGPLASTREKGPVSHVSEMDAGCEVLGDVASFNDDDGA